MSARNKLLAAPPYAVEMALERLGANLKTARLRRKITVSEVAERIGTGRRAVDAAEAGNPSTGIAVYAALLWAYGLLDPFGELADPARDEEGRALAQSREPTRVRRSPGDIDDDF